MSAGDWKGELDRLLKIFEVESTISLKKIKQYFVASGHQFNDDFRKYFLKMSTCRLDSSFDTVLFEGLREAISADSQIEIGQTDNTNDDEHHANSVNDMIESQAETSDENIDEVCVKLEVKVENEIEDDVQLSFVEFDPNKANECASVEEAVVATAVLSAQSQSSTTSNAQERSKLTAAKSFKCSVCKYVTRNEYNFKRHQLIHKGDITKSFKCERCNFSCRQKFSLDRHKRTHTRQESMGVMQDQNDLFKCPHCDQRFTKWNGLNAHVTRSHKNNQRLINCLHCMRRFAQKPEKDRYEVRCQIRRYECYLCKAYVTNRLTNMQDHLRTHTGAKPFECSICMKCFRLKGALKRHLDSIHKCE